MLPPPQPPPIKLTSLSPLPDVIITAFSLLTLFSIPPKPNNKLLSFSFIFQSRKFPKMPPPFTTPQSLSNWLQPRIPSDTFQSWGIKPGTKNIHNLFLEISQGETQLTDSIPPVRSVEVVVVRIIRNDNKVLVESHQELSDGSVRERGRPLSEKMKPGESVEKAVFRAVKEELGSLNGRECDVRIMEGSYVKKVEERVSVSYPGLPACYVLHTVNAEVGGLPEGEFVTEEESEYGEGVDETRAVSCKKHYWKWVGLDSV